MTKVVIVASHYTGATDYDSDVITFRLNYALAPGLF